MKVHNHQKKEKDDRGKTPRTSNNSMNKRCDCGLNKDHDIKKLQKELKTKQRVNTYWQIKHTSTITKLKKERNLIQEKHNQLKEIVDSLLEETTKLLSACTEYDQFQPQPLRVMEETTSSLIKYTEFGLLQNTSTTKSTK